MKKTVCTLMAALAMLSCFATTALAVDYTFEAENNDDFYRPTPYEEVYGSEYRYGGPNAVDLVDHTALLPGIVSPTPQQTSPSGAGLPSYNDPATYYPAAAGDSFITEAVYTPISELIRSDGSIGTLKIPSLSINMKIYEGTTPQSMDKGLGHFADTSGWNGNVAVCGHNRGAKYTIGAIKNMKIGDVIEYSTVLGACKYAVSFVGTISSSDWSYVSATSDNRITLITCLADQPSQRVCVQAVEIK